METIILQDWITVSGTGSTPLIQDPAGWVSGSGYSDWTFWLDCSFVSPASSVALSYETAPCPDDASFQSAGTVNPIAASTAPVVTRALLSRSTVAPPATWLRWKLQGPAAGTWSMTFRILASRGRTGGGTFEPRQFLGCTLWLRADMGITVASGSVSRWADQSGNGNDATQGTAANQPALTTSNPSFGGHPSVGCTISGGNARFLVTGTFSSSIVNDMTAYVVARSPGSGAANRYLFDSLNPAAQVAMYADVTGTTLFAYTLAGGNYISFNGTMSNTQCLILSAKAGQAATLRINSSIPNQTTSGDPVGFTMTGCTVGSYAGAGPYSDWEIAELALFSRQLDAQEIATLNGYAAARYGVVIA